MTYQILLSLTVLPVLQTLAVCKDFRARGERISSVLLGAESKVCPVTSTGPDVTSVTFKNAEICKHEHSLSKKRKLLGVL
jgi:hypothetical protein